MQRLYDAKALRITANCDTDKSLATMRLVHEIERLPESASSNLQKLQTLVSHSLDAHLATNNAASDNHPSCRPHTPQGKRVTWLLDLQPRHA